MKVTVSFVIFLFALSSVNCGPKSGEEDDDVGGRKRERNKKKMECMKQTQELKACCPLPKSTEDFKSDPECGHHLEGFEDKQGKEKFHSIVCFAECMFTSRGIIGEDKEILWEEIKKQSNDVLGESDDFKEVTESAIEFCEAQFNEMKDHWKNKPKHHHHDDEKKCSFKAFGSVKCILGYVVRNCPEQIWTGTDECNKLKTNATAIEDCMK